MQHEICMHYEKQANTFILCTLLYTFWRSYATLNLKTLPTVECNKMLCGMLSYVWHMKLTHLTQGWKTFCLGLREFFSLGWFLSPVTYGTVMKSYIYIFFRVASRIAKKWVDKSFLKWESVTYFQVESKK